MKRYKFKAAIQAGVGGGAAVIFPYDVQKEFGTRGMVPVKATFNDVLYTGSLVKCGSEGHMLGILKAIREQIGRGLGDTVDVVVWKDEAARTVEIPPQFRSQLEKSGMLPAFAKLSFTHRKEYCKWIAEAKKEETRSARIVKAIEMLGKGKSTRKSTA